MRKILIITYHFPPIGLAGSVRWTKFSKYLPRFGFEPIILTVKPISYYFYDPDLLKETPDIRIYRSESLDPARVAVGLIGKKRTISTGLTGPSVLFHQLLFPDAKFPWIPFAFHLGCKIIKKENPDIVLATSPPYSSLLLGLLLKKIFSIPLVLEFRDPWPTSIYPPDGYQKMLLENLRARLFVNADRIITVSEQVAMDLGIKTDVISHGYDPDDYIVTDKKSDLVHIGATYEYEEELAQFIEVVSQLKQIRFKLIGSTSRRIKHLMDITDNCSFLGLLPHNKAMERLSESEILVYFYAKEGDYLTSKFYEYLGANRQILAITNKINKTQTSVDRFNVGFTVPIDKELIVSAIKKLKIKGRWNKDQFDQYSFVNLTEGLSEIFNQLQT